MFVQAPYMRIFLSVSQQASYEDQNGKSSPGCSFSLVESSKKWQKAGFEPTQRGVTSHFARV